MIVLAVLAILFAVSLVAWRPDAARRTAREVHALVLAARLDALQRGRPTAVLLESGPTGLALVVRRGRTVDALDRVCVEGDVVRRLSVPIGVRLTSLRDDLVWLPSGYGRRCDGSAAANGTVRIEGRRTAWALRIATAGRVRRERLG